MARVFGVTLIVVGIALIVLGIIGLYGHWFTDTIMIPSVFEVVYWMVAGAFGMLVGIVIWQNT